MEIVNKIISKNKIYTFATLFNFVIYLYLGIKQFKNLNCGNDGLRYCSMAGASRLIDKIDSPYDKRILLPKLVDIFSNNDTNRIIIIFLVYNLIFFTLILFLLYNLLKKYDNQENLLFLLLVISLNPYLLYLILISPVLTDWLALLFLLLFIKFIMEKRYSLLVPISILGSLNRENWLVIFVITIFAIKSNGLLSFKLKLQYVLIIVSVYLLISHFYISSNNFDLAFNVTNTYVEYFQIAFDSKPNVVRFLYQILVGVSPIILFIPFIRKDIQKNDLVYTSALISSIYFALSVFAGGDLERILLPIFLLLTLIYSNQQKKSNNYSLNKIFVIITCYIVWNPLRFHLNDGQRSNSIFFARFWDNANWVLTRSKIEIGLVCAFYLLYIIVFNVSKGNKLQNA
jgi:hypothetical protein